jgi:type II secretory pathway component PulM
MSVPGLLVALVLLVAIIIMIVPPLFEREKPSEDESAAAQAELGAQRERLLAYYNRVLTNIRDLDEDQATGKINPADYETERELWMQRGIQALKALDESAPADVPTDDPVEKAVAAYRERTRNAAAKRK